MNLGRNASEQQKTIFKILTKIEGWHTTEELMEEFIKATFRPNNFRRSLNRMEERGLILKKVILKEPPNGDGFVFLWRRVPNE